jgi:hypothetical protein
MRPVDCIGRRYSGRALGLWLLAWSQAGCGAGWRRTGELPPGALSPKQQAEVWHGGRADRLHAVILSADSISGVPYLQPQSCDSCRVAFAQTAVDSVRLGHPERGFWRSVGLALGGTLVLAVVACALRLGGSCQLSD